jgi:hypothetical protein
MTTSLIRLGRALLLSAIVIVAAEPMSVAGTNVLVIFSGANASGTRFSGYFEYDVSQPKQTDYVFNFNGSAFTHEICYHTGSATCNGSGSTSEPFSITTSRTNSFVLKSKCVTSNTSVVISFSKLNVTCLPNVLPSCTSGTTEAFPNTGTFTLSGGTNFSGTITAAACIQAASVISCPCPPPGTFLSDEHPAPARAPVNGSPQAPVYECYIPALAPMYAIAPEPACCFSRFFGRHSHRPGCR